MRAKILLLPAGEPGNRMAQSAGQILTEISAAFGHVFMLMREKIGESSVKAYGVPLTGETVDAAKVSAAALLLSASEEDAQGLQDALELAVEITSFCVPASLCSRHEVPARLWTAKALATDEETLFAAADTVFRYAGERDAAVASVAPSGGAKAAWESAVAQAQADHPHVKVIEALPREIMRDMLLHPAQGHIVFCPPYAGELFCAAACASFAYPNLTHGTALGESTALFSAGTALGKAHDDPFSLAFAIIDLLRIGLGLENEAACVEAAVNNVLLSGWRTKDLAGDDSVEPEKIIELICEQISVAGELMNKGAF